MITSVLTLRYDLTQKPILPKITPRNFHNSTPTIAQIENIVEKSLTKIRIKPKKIVIALSGGIDSTLALNFLKKSFPDSKIDAISIKFSDSVDESKLAAKIAKHFDVDQHVVSVDNYLEELPKAISIAQMPFWDLHWYYVAKKAQTIAKYLATGDGGDELFGGYVFRYKKFLSIVTRNSSPLQKVKAYLQCHERDSVVDQEDLFGKKSAFSWTKIYDKLLPYFDNSLSLIDQVFLADYNGKLLYNFSLVNKRINENFKLIGITPLLSKELISYAVGISSKYKYDKQSDLGKLLLRKILVKNRLDSLVSNQKLGFSVNTINLWSSYGRKIFQYYFSNARIVQDGWIDQDWINKHVQSKNLDVRYVNKFLGILAFEIWYRLFITKEIKSDTLLDF
ncbi:MAG: asparagine synthase [Nitrososphaeria archaeon]|nr:asparagine synthase [Nitrososphaeria archaeon]NDB51705.1 asparagine synthase [Nitrosopumilaceae archaeon]NDB88495.1 asparagine synthase [Nitrososphaerota archaeon]NDB46681.1 asparagine synthase [Nitrososphaeria archaeon]NDB90374.1 asparagine synthase [Nitrososphaerota archaeon]